MKITPLLFLMLFLPGNISTQKQKTEELNFSIFSRYALKSQIEGEGQAFYGIYQGHAFDLGVGAEVVF